MTVATPCWPSCSRPWMVGEPVQHRTGASGRRHAATGEAVPTRLRCRGAVDEVPRFRHLPSGRRRSGPPRRCGCPWQPSSRADLSQLPKSDAARSLVPELWPTAFGATPNGPANGSQSGMPLPEPAAGEHFIHSPGPRLLRRVHRSQSAPRPPDPPAGIPGAARSLRRLASNAERFVACRTDC